VSNSYGSRGDQGADFCAGCGKPGPWLDRPKLVEWMQSQIKASSELSPPERLELLTVLDKLKAMEANDDRAVSGWKRVRDGAPKVWETTKPVRDVLLTEGVKKLLGL